MMKFLHLHTYCFPPLASRLSLVFYSVLTANAHCWNRARMGFPVAPLHRAAVGCKQLNFCRKTGASNTTPSRWVDGTTPVLAWVPGYLGAMREIKRLHQIYINPGA